MKTEREISEGRWEQLLGAGFLLTIFSVLAMSAAHLWPWGWLAAWLESDKASGWAQALCALLALPLAILVLKLQQEGEHKRERERDHLARLERLKLTGIILMQTQHVFSMGLSLELGGQDRWRIHKDTLDTAKERVLSIPVLELADSELVVSIEAVVYFLRMAWEICGSMATLAPAEAEKLLPAAQKILFDGWIESGVAAETIDRIFESAAVPGDRWISQEMWIAMDRQRRTRVNAHVALARERAKDPKYPKVNRSGRAQI